MQNEERRWILCLLIQLFACSTREYKKNPGFLCFCLFKMFSISLSLESGVRDVVWMVQRKLSLAMAGGWKSILKVLSNPNSMV